MRRPRSCSATRSRRAPATRCSNRGARRSTSQRLPPGVAPCPHRDDGVRPLDHLPRAPSRPDGLVPARRNEAGGEVREWREDEQALTNRGMWDLQETRGRTGVDGGGGGNGVARSLDGQARAAEQEQVEVKLARAPALATPPTERALEILEGDEQG